MTKTVAVGEAEWSDIITDVKNHHEVVITEGGAPVARVVPIENELRGPMYGTITFLGAIDEPLAEEWKAQQCVARSPRERSTLEELRSAVRFVGDVETPAD